MEWKSRRHRGASWFVPVLCVGLSGHGCGPDTEPPRPEPATMSAMHELTLPVRVHLLKSERVVALDATLTDDEVEEVFDGVNRIWAPASIIWEVVDIVREPALAQDEFERRGRDGQRRDMTFLQTLLPTGQLWNGGWDVFIGRRIGGAPGVYFGGLPAVLTSEVGPDRQRMSANMIRVLAHELGHSLGLRHVACPDGGNLMAAGCPPLDAGPITPGQAEMARAGAAARLEGAGR